ncbi:MAG: ferrous iron transport protein A [Erysipelotrichaceae bacterium]|nr:ferrous iron transport protein A [Erysipelotrichaceae bacterium]
MMLLTLMNEGSLLKILKINGKKETKTFLESLGFVNGADISIVQKMDGNIIVNIKDSRVAINKDIANKIIVQEVL